MSELTTVSAKVVIARVIRNIGRANFPSDFANDLLAWLPEGIDKLETTYSLIPEEACLTVKDFSLKLPCCIQVLEAVEYEGYRLREGNPQRTPGKSPSSARRTEVYQTDTVLKVDGVPHRDNFGLKATHLPLHGSEYYKRVLDYLQFSFECGEVTLYYQVIPHDCGYPLIPDNENYKTALYWYIVSMMTGTGWEHPNKGFSFAYCDSMFEKFAARAIGDITYPTPDRMERMRQSSVRLIPPQHYWEDFFINSEQPKYTQK